MDVNRRALVLGLGSALTLTACLGGDAGGALVVKSHGVVGMNPGPDGSERSLVLSIIQMTATATFDGSDFFALQDPATALGGDHIRTDQIVVTAGNDTATTLVLEDATIAIGVVAGFRAPDGKQFRTSITVPGGKNAGIVVSINAAGINVSAS